MSESKSVILNGQILHGNDRLGHWKVTQLDGWGDSPPVRSQDVERANADGDFDLPVYYGSRPVTIGGRVICPTPAVAQLVRDRLTGLVRGLVRAQVMDEGMTTWADVKLTDAVTTKRVGSLVRFQYQLRAPDSRRFGDFESFAIAAGAGVGVHHRGNYDANPLIRVHGPTAAYTITGPDGEQYTVTGGLGSGNEHVIDFNDGLLRVNGVITAAAVTMAELWRVPPGQKVTATLSAGNGHIEVLDTYI